MYRLPYRISHSERVIYFSFVCSFAHAGGYVNKDPLFAKLTGVDVLGFVNLAVEQL